MSVEGRRWTVEDAFETAKNELGLDTTRRAPGTAGTAMSRWSMQKIRRIAVRLAQRRIAPAQVIAWSLWRRAHQAEAKEAHLKIKPQL